MNALVLDIGNTRTKLGVFDQQQLVETVVWSDWSIEQLMEQATRYAPECILVSSVAEPDPDLLPALRQLAPVTELNALTPLPFQNHYATPHTLGKDRLAAVAGAQALFPGCCCVIVDCGTCIKYEWLDAGGHYRGGNIAPGLSMRIRAMHEFTARLPEVPVEMPGHPIGNSTTTALQNGALRGAALEIEGFVRLFSQQTSDNKVQVVMTGGDAPFLSRYVQVSPLVVEPSLTLIGLNAILQKSLAH